MKMSKGKNAKQATLQQQGGKGNLPGTGKRTPKSMMSKKYC